MSVYPQPGSSESPIEIKERYGHWIGGRWTDPVKGEYFDNPTPVTGQVYAQPLLANGTLLGTLTSAPYVVGWNSTGVADGVYTLTTKAYDKAEDKFDAAPRC